MNYAVSVDSVLTLNKDIREARTCFENTAYKATMVLCGSVLERRALAERTFLIQSKNPRIFNDYRFPRNVLLGTTIETNRDNLYEEISKAPLPSQRYKAMLKLEHPRKIVTIKPILDFDVRAREVRGQGSLIVWKIRNQHSELGNGLGT
jgi:hypothetical protein